MLSASVGQGVHQGYSFLLSGESSGCSGVQQEGYNTLSVEVQWLWLCLLGVGGREEWGIRWGSGVAERGRRGGRQLFSLGASHSCSVSLCQDSDSFWSHSMMYGRV